MNDLIRSIIKALLAAFITATVLIFIFAFVASKSTDSTKNLELFGRIIFFIASFVGIITALRSVNEKYFVTALIFMAVYLMICYAFSLVLGGGKFLELWIMYLGAFALVPIGVFLGNTKKPKKPKGLKKYKKLSKG